MADRPVPACWCGGDLGKEIGPHYRICDECGSAVLAVSPAAGHFEVSDDDRDFYGRRYWTEYSLARGLPDIRDRARADLSERCLFWLERLLEVVRPPGRSLEIGCGHGAFVRLLQEIGFDATGTELSGWVVEFAKQTFGVRVLRGPLAELGLEPGFSCVAAFDVLEHLSDPTDLVRRCGDLLAPDGVLLLQTPWYRGEGDGWSMLQEDEHVHLFTEESIRMLLTRAGFRELLVQPSFFPYDMWVVATRGRLHVSHARMREASAGWRLPAAFTALLDLAHQASGLRDELASADGDRTARLAQVEDVTRLLRESEKDRAARLTQVADMTQLLRESEADRAARLDQVEAITALLRESEADRAARLAQVQEMTGLLRESEADRAARLVQMGELTRRLQESEAARVSQLADFKRRLDETEADRTARLSQLEKMAKLLKESEADRAARLSQLEKMAKLLKESEADRAARLEQIRDLSRLLEEAKSGETARLHEISGLTSRLEEVDAHLASRLAQIDELSHLLGETESDRVSRLEQIHELSRMLRELDADREARMDVIHRLEARIAAIERTWIWRLRRALPSMLMGRKSEG